jgi:hypothetical protein
MQSSKPTNPLSRIIIWMVTKLLAILQQILPIFEQLTWYLSHIAPLISSPLISPCLSACFIPLTHSSYQALKLHDDEDGVIDIMYNTECFRVNKTTCPTSSYEQYEFVRYGLDYLIQISLFFPLFSLSLLLPPSSSPSIFNFISSILSL